LPKEIPAGVDIQKAVVGLHLFMDDASAVGLLKHVAAAFFGEAVMADGDVHRSVLQGAVPGFRPAILQDIITVDASLPKLADADGDGESGHVGQEILDVATPFACKNASDATPPGRREDGFIHRSVLHGWVARGFLPVVAGELVLRNPPLHKQIPADDCCCAIRRTEASKPFPDIAVGACEEDAIVAFTVGADGDVHRSALQG